MKRVKLAVVRSITTEELYEVVVEDKEASVITTLAEGKDKDALADAVEDAYQMATRRGEYASYKETSVNDKVTFTQYKVINVKE